MKKAQRFIGVALGAVLVLSGCVKQELHLVLQPDQKADIVGIVAVDKSVQQLVGAGALDQLISNSIPGAGNAGQANVEDWSEGDWVGKKITQNGVSFDQVKVGKQGGGGFSLTQDGDNYVLEAKLPLSKISLPAGLGTQIKPAIKIEVTFPGAISTSNGQVNGNSVVWNIDDWVDKELQAVGSAVPNSNATFAGMPLPVLLGIGAGVLLVAAVLVYMVMRSRRARQVGGQYPPHQYYPQYQQPGPGPNS